MGGGQSKAAPTSHSISCSSGLGDLGVGGLVKRAFFLYLFSAFSLPVSLPLFHHCCPPSLPRSQITGPSSSWPCVEKEHATGSWAFRCFAFAAAAAAATPPLPPPPPHSVSSRGGFSASSLGPREQGRPQAERRGSGQGQCRCLLPIQRALYTGNYVTGLWGSAVSYMQGKLSWCTWVPSQRVQLRGNI